MPPPALRELSEAASLHLRLRAQRDARLGPLNDKSARWSELVRDYERSGREGEEGFMIFGQIEETNRQIEIENRLYEAQKAELARRYPVLASFAEGDQTWQLEQLSKGTPSKS